MRRLRLSITLCSGRIGLKRARVVPIVVPIDSQNSGWARTMVDCKKNAQSEMEWALALLHRALPELEKQVVINPPDRRVDQASLRPDLME